MVTRSLKEFLFLFFLFSQISCYIESLEELELSLRSVKEEVEFDPHTILVKFTKEINAEQFGSRYGLMYSGVKMEDEHLFVLKKPEFIEDMVSSISSIKVVQDVRRVPHQIGHRLKRGSTDNWALHRNPLYRFQWHLTNTGVNGRRAGEDVGALNAWSRNFTGIGITIAVVDDGADLSHPDLMSKINTAYSKDYLTGSASAEHKTILDMQGTSVAGLIAAADNQVCGLGVAYNANLAIRRVASGSAVQFSTLIDALRENNNEIDIFSNSWTDYKSYVDYDTLYGMTDVLFSTTLSGRSGMGSIIVQSAGSGREAQRITSETVFTSNPYTIVVGAINDYGIRTEYSTPGANVFVVAYSGDSGHASLFTSDRLGDPGNSPGDCTDFSGTSGATAIASGVIAQMLQAHNNNITSRDVNWILVRSASIVDINSTGWQRNGAGYYVSHQYGFGKINSEQAVKFAGSWSKLNIREVVVVDSDLVILDGSIPDSSSRSWNTSIHVSSSMYIEQVEVFVNITIARRGDLSITLVSPAGTHSYLKAKKLNDKGSDLVWTFTSVMHWGELSSGTWTLHITDNVPSSASGTIHNWSFIVRGVSILPFEQPNTPANATTPVGSCTVPNTQGGCATSSVAKCVCTRDAYCCLFAWDESCVRKASLWNCL